MTKLESVLYSFHVNTNSYNLYFLVPGRLTPDLLVSNCSLSLLTAVQCQTGSCATWNIEVQAAQDLVQVMFYSNGCQGKLGTFLSIVIRIVHQSLERSIFNTLVVYFYSYLLNLFQFYQSIELASLIFVLSGYIYVHSNI